MTRDDIITRADGTQIELSPPAGQGSSSKTGGCGKISHEPGETRYCSRLIELKCVGENSECRDREEPA
jgi:hypothetical protein